MIMPASGNGYGVNGSDFNDTDPLLPRPPTSSAPHATNCITAALRKIFCSPGVKAFMQSPAVQNTKTLLAFTVFAAAASTGAYGSYKLADKVLSYTELSQMAKDISSGVFGSITGIINWGIFIDSFKSFHLPTGKGGAFWTLCIFSTIANAILSALLTYEQMPFEMWGKMIFSAVNGLGNLPFGVDSFVTVTKNFDKIGKFWKNSTTTACQKITLLINLALIIIGILCMLIGYSEPVVTMLLASSLDIIMKYVFMVPALLLGNLSEAAFQLIQALGIKSYTFSIFTWDDVKKLQSLLSPEQAPSGMSRDLIDKIRKAQQDTYEEIPLKSGDRTSLLQLLQGQDHAAMQKKVNDTVWNGHMPNPFAIEDRDHPIRCFFIMLFAAIGGIPYSAFTLFALLPYLPLEAVATLAMLALLLPTKSCMDAAQKMIVNPIEKHIVNPVLNLVGSYCGKPWACCCGTCYDCIACGGAAE